jgi:hypothetical protein
MLNKCCLSVSHLMGSWRYLVYCRLMKFSVAPKSMRASASALLDFECA